MTEQNLLRPNQVAEMTEEKARLERSLKNPHTQDKGAAANALRRISKQLETQTPKPFEGNEVDKAIRREQELREQILRGMPSQEEMRKAPPGAVGKHQEWEKRTKPLLAEWKNLRLRLNSGSEDPDVANFERFRPKTSTINMDNSIVSGKQYFMPETSGPTVTFNDDEIARIRELAPDLAAKLSMLNNVQRAEVKEVIREEKATRETKRKGMSPEKRAEMSARMKARHAARRQETAGPDTDNHVQE